MIGYHSVADDCGRLLQRLPRLRCRSGLSGHARTAMQDRNGLEDLQATGLRRIQTGPAATSKTLEYTYDDWCMARMAEALGHTDDAKLYYKRSAITETSSTRQTQFFRGRKANGQWRTPFDAKALVGDEYTEADAWQYAFAVQQDVPGMIRLYGGDQGFIQKMDTLFTEDSYHQHQHS